MSIYVWIGIFIIQPHKEERFMYVIYPLICYNAAHAMNSSTKLLELLCARKLSPQISRQLTRVAKGCFIMVYATLSLARVVAQVRAFSAPMHVYGAIRDYSSICLGKEWYRYPSSFFIPENSETFFVKSAFDGLLPGRFPPPDSLGWRSGTWQMPTGMNDRNLEEKSHHVRCLVRTS
jgi:alpha-1,2-mannosyltransferase